jgi:hypothetical protein
VLLIYTPALTAFLNANVRLHEEPTLLKRQTGGDA